MKLYIINGNPSDGNTYFLIFLIFKKMTSLT